jgi:hypothetical protein
MTVTMDTLFRTIKHPRDDALAKVPSRCPPLHPPLHLPLTHPEPSPTPHPTLTYRSPRPA